MFSIHNARDHSGSVTNVSWRLQVGGGISLPSVIGPAVQRTIDPIRIGAITPRQEITPEIQGTIAGQSPTLQALAANALESALGPSVAPPATNQPHPLHQPKPEPQAQAAEAFPPDLKPTVEHLQNQGLEAVDPLTLEIDAERFQFKSGSDAQGQLGTLNTVEEFDDNKAGTIMVFEENDGTRFVVDGHQRVGLVKRLTAEGKAEGVRIMAKVLKESDGFTPSDARRIAAEINIAQGTGTAIDAAKILREISPQAREETLRRNKETVC